MNDPVPPAPPAVTPPRSLPLRSSRKRTVLLTLAVLAGLGAITAASAAWWYHYNFHATLHPVQLTAEEAKAVDQKVDALKGKPQAPPVQPASDPSKTIVLNEREINGFLEQQGLGDQFNVSIHKGALGATALLPLDKDFPVLGGRTIRLKVAFNTKLDARSHPNFSLTDVNVGGISLPNEWLGNIKGINLLEDLQDNDFFKGLSAGIKDFQIQEGELRVVLKD